MGLVRARDREIAFRQQIVLRCLLLRRCVLRVQTSEWPDAIQRSLEPLIFRLAMPMARPSVFGSIAIAVYCFGPMLLLPFCALSKGVAYTIIDPPRRTYILGFGL